MTVASGGTIRVLHVDDDPEFAELTATFLQREDDRFVVETASSAAEGLDRIETSRPDCVVSDYNMPGKNGLAFLEAVRSEYADLPFILYTGRGSETVASEAISAGVTEYLQKSGGTEQYAMLANKISNAVERTEAEVARKRHLAAVESAQEGISILDEDGRFVYVNGAYADIYGYEPAEMLGEHWELVYPDAATDVAYDEILPAVASEGYWHGETTGLRADGSTFPEEHVVSRTETGDMVCTVRDISDTRDREADLALKERAMDEAPVGITLTDPSQDDNPLVYVNDRFEEITGYDRAEILGRNCRLLQGEGTDPEPVAKLRAAIDDERPVTVELRNYRADGTEFWNRVTVAPIADGTGEVTNFVGFQEVVTERTERELALERKNKRLDAFTGMVSHDLRNPLHVAEGSLELAREECDNEHVDRASEAVDRSLALVDDLLTLAREGRDLDDVEAVSLADVLEACWTTVDTEAATLAIRGDVRLRADRSRLVQLLENLVRNAVEHGGRDVTVTAGRLDGGFYVADDGPGIPLEERQAVFEPGHSTNEDGTGIGLAIVERIADAHGWDISVTTGPEGGARFEFTGVDPVG
ncbi:PAS domain S-box protein [Halomicroarcula sp. GCM10025817]|uniref:hybrid sensor histidine kinase/response regulator n=1 Tax=Haloarcula TaxID=2237 RepID=UPI0023E86418|nr:PAS domain S-box protein [Halomicroarcula sp. SYNS111]